ncbi:MAG: DEAD/DEAH box helicase family protein [Candidatus Acidiferrum sp.]
MSYFSTHYDKLRFPLSGSNPSGFRAAQVAAIHAVSSHFFNSRQAAVVTMPTGSGKTTVLMALAFVLRAERVLILTPSRLVREQIAENFGALVDLKKIEALPLDLPTPRVFATEGTIGSDQAWEDLRDYDVVVATVPSVSPRDGIIPAPPADLFDLVLVDEAHHSPAKSWSRLLELLRLAKQVLCTATPFRRDEKEIKGKLVFTYDLRKAYTDRVFGDITFEPVVRGDAPSIDIAIARATEARFRSDREARLQHLVMVRTDSIARGKELKRLYDENTALRLAFVSGAHGLGFVKRVIAKLRAFELDGIVCVNMFGEGFDLPNLKIAAIHSPHKSLAITLQFIGRFARTGQVGIGGATFLAEPTSSSDELGELYEAGAVWRDIVQNLAAGRVEEERRTREVIDSFAVDAAPDMEDFSLYTVQPYFHVKVFSTPDGADLDVEPTLPKKMNIIFRGVSDPHGAAVYLTREAVRSEWSTDERFTNVAFDIFIFHYNPAARLLFICSSRRHAKLYSFLAKQLANGRPRPLSSNRINRVLNDLRGAEFFNVGMRKRNKLGQVESYRIIAGPSADKAVNPTDARTFDRGHYFGRALENGNEVTIGVSVGSKVWSNRYDRIPELLEWCNRLATRITSRAIPVTGSGLDLLSIGEELTYAPEGIIAMTWSPATYADVPHLVYLRAGVRTQCDLLDCDLEVMESRRDILIFAIRNRDVEWRGQYSLVGDDLFQPASQNEPDLSVLSGNEEVAIEDYLNEVMPTLYCADLSSIEGQSLFRAPVALQAFDDNSFEIVDWDAANVEITSEKVAGRGRHSIFDWLRARLVASDARVVFCDDGSGEMADFVAIFDSAEGPRVKMYHCKASSEERAGHRVADLQIVCAQAIKSCVWCRPEEFSERLRYRAGLEGVPGYEKGDENVAMQILTQQVLRQVQFDTFIVQPGIRREGRTEVLSNLLAAARDYVTGGGVSTFQVIGS